MSTIVCFHAHPDDEVMTTGGTMAMAAAAGHRVVLVTATGGEHGEHEEGLLAPGESLGERRARELAASAEILGVARTEMLGYVDSGMAGTPENRLDGAFCRADVDEAAGRLAAILDDERADVLTIYDRNGNYGHPDHIQVHRVGGRAAELALRPPAVFEATVNRDAMRRLIAVGAELGVGDEAPSAAEIEGLGVSEEEITTTVDVSRFAHLKRSALAAHASQVADTSMFLAMPEDVFALAFGTEWFIHRGVPAGTVETSVLGDEPAAPSRADRS